MNLPWRKLLLLTALGLATLNFSAPQLGFQAAVEIEDKGWPTWQWRLAEVSPGANLPLSKLKYEITALWQTNGTARVQMPSSLLDAGRTYRVRVRVQDGRGRCGHWSEPVQFTVAQ